MPESSRQTWKDEQTNALIEMWPRVSSIVLIALALNRTTSSVQTQASRKGLPRRSEANERHRRKWTADDIVLLEKTLERHTSSAGEISICEIAEDMKRSIDAVSSKLADMFGGEELLFPKLKVTQNVREAFKAEEIPANVDRRKIQRERPCLRCKRPFWSEGAHNRICIPCKKEEAGADGFDW